MKCTYDENYRPLIFLSGRTCTIGGWLNTFLPHCRTRFTVDIDTFVPVSSSIFTRSFAVVLGLTCTFSTKVLSSPGDRTRFFLSGMTAEWSHGVYTCILLFVQMNVVPSGIWKLLQRMNQTCEGLQLFSEVLANLFWFPHDVKQRGTEFEGRPWDTSTCTPQIDANYVN